MDEGDTEDLLPNSDEDWMTENEEQCLPVDKQFICPNNLNQTDNTFQSKFQFIGIGFLLIISSTFLLICLPLYSNSVEVTGDAYTLIFFTSTVTVIFLFILTLLSKRFFDKNDMEMNTWSIFEAPVPLHYILKISISLGLSVIMIIYAIDQKRVMCHLQDPIKGIILVFSLVFYFFFCRKLMGLQRIFSCTTIIVGLFISVDYGLCDEFRCRGYERETRAEDAGDWTSRTHALWAGLYILGLALYAAHFTILERCLVPICSQPLVYTNVTPSLLSTISRLVSSTDTVTLTAAGPSSSSRTTIDLIRSKTPKSILCLTLWIHFCIWALIVCTFWIDLNPGVGKATTLAGFWNVTTDGLICHFKPPAYFEQIPTNKCGNVSIYAWPFVIIYVIFSVTAIKFLAVSQSAVFTVAMITVALPVTGIWWSLFEINEMHNGAMLWAPSVSGELICSLLGLPIVLLGVGLLYKSHFKEMSEIRAEHNSNSGGTSIEHEYSSASTGLA